MKNTIILISILLLIPFATAVDEPEHEYNFDDIDDIDFEDWDELYENATWVDCLTCQDFTDFQADDTIVDLFLDIDFTGESDFSALSGSLDLLVNLEYLSIWIYGVEDSVTDLTGLENLIDNNDLLLFIDIWIEGMMIDDISVLDGFFDNNTSLEMIYIDLSYTSITTTLDFLGAFPNSVLSLNLYLGYTMIDDISDLPLIFSDLPDLLDASLDLSGMNMTDFTDLTDLFDTNTMLQYVYVSLMDNNFTSLNGLNDIFGTMEMDGGMVSLDFWMNQITDISGVKDVLMTQTALEGFDIWFYDNMIDDISVFSEAFMDSTSLEWIGIELMENPVMNLDPFMMAFKNCDSLEYLYIGLTEECYIDESHLNNNLEIEQLQPKCSENYTFSGGFGADSNSNYLSFALLSLLIFIASFL